MTKRIIAGGGPKSKRISRFRQEHKDAFMSWRGMRERCIQKTHVAYRFYGGKGITFDPRWESFDEFFKDMGDPPMCTVTMKRMVLDRKDSQKNYTRENCRWASELDNRVPRRSLREIISQGY